MELLFLSPIAMNESSMPLTGMMNKKLVPKEPDRTSENAKKPSFFRRHEEKLAKAGVIFSVMILAASLIGVSVVLVYPVATIVIGVVSVACILHFISELK